MSLSESQAKNMVASHTLSTLFVHSVGWAHTCKFIGLSQTASQNRTKATKIN